VFQKFTPHFFSQALQTLYPKVDRFLNGETDFQFLMSIMLSAQMTDKGVNKATTPLFVLVKTPADVVKMGPEKLYQFVKSVNYAPTKAKNIFKTAQILCEQFEGRLPKTRKELMTLPGVGAKTAGVFTVQKGYEAAFPVDTHVARVARAFGFTTEKDPSKIERDLQKIFPKEEWLPLHLRIILYGRNVVTARKIPQSPKEAFEELERVLRIGSV